MSDEQKELKDTGSVPRPTQTVFFRSPQKLQTLQILLACETNAQLWSSICQLVCLPVFYVIVCFFLPLLKVKFIYIGSSSRCKRYPIFYVFWSALLVPAMVWRMAEYLQTLYPYQYIMYLIQTILYVNIFPIHTIPFTAVLTLYYFFNVKP